MWRTLAVLSWVSFDLPDHYKRTLSMLLQAAGEGCNNLHMVPIEGRDNRDDQIATEHGLQQVLIDMVPTPGKSNEAGGSIIRTLLTEFLRGFSLRNLIFLLDMFCHNLMPITQVDNYNTYSRGWVSNWHNSRTAANQESGSMSRINMRPMPAFMSSSCILTEPQSCCLAIQRPSPNSHRGTYVRRVI